MNCVFSILVNIFFQIWLWPFGLSSVPDATMTYHRFQFRLFSQFCKKNDEIIAEKSMMEQVRNSYRLTNEQESHIIYSFPLISSNWNISLCENVIYTFYFNIIDLTIRVNECLKYINNLCGTILLFIDKFPFVLFFFFYFIHPQLQSY